MTDSFLIKKVSCTYGNGLYLDKYCKLFFTENEYLHMILLSENLTISCILFQNRLEEFGKISPK